MSNLVPLMKRNFLEYASYTILDRALPELRDGCKPVQRRILHTLFEMDDGLFHKVANVIGERIRDKVAASRKRGMWMGGYVPLGYDVRDRKLVVNDAEAALVRRVFQGFVETESRFKENIEVLRALVRR